MKALEIAWGNKPGKVFLSTLHRDTRTWRDNVFNWPEDREEIPDFIERHREGYEIYWAPARFSTGKRREAGVKPLTCLWADLDTTVPSKCFIEPSIAWESSPGRYQCLWLLDKPIDPVDGAELNKRMTYAVGADKSGWDLTQVLRVPGTINHKYVEKPTVRLLWVKKLYYGAQDLADRLPAVVSDKSIDPLDIETSDLREVVWPYRKILGDKLWQLLFTPDSVVSEDDRSERLWELECRLLESGVPVSEVLRIAKACPWNKFRGRPDEDKRILLEVLKAEKHIKTSPIITTDSAVPWVSYAQFMGRTMVGPGWLVEGWWGNNSHGMLAGEPKTYKSVIATELAVSIASGYPVFDKYKVIKPGPVLYIQEENPSWVVQDRFAKIAYAKGLMSGHVYKMKRDDVFHVEFPPELPIRLLNTFGTDLTAVEHRELLVREIELTKPSFIILDPLYLMLGNTDENSAQELRGLLQWLLQVKLEYRTSIMILHHWNKGGKSERGGQRMLGSTTFHAWVESAIYTSIRDVKTNEITVEREFRSYMKPELLGVTFKMSSPGAETPEYSVIMREARDNKPTNVKLTCLEFLATNGSGSAQEIAQVTGISRQGVAKQLKRFVEEGKITKKKGGRGRSDESLYLITGKGRAALEIAKGEQEVASDDD